MSQEALDALALRVDKIKHRIQLLAELDVSPSALTILEDRIKAASEAIEAAIAVCPSKHKEPNKSCRNCGNQCMDMDMDPFCSAVNKPWGLVLHRGHPEDCGPSYRLWTPDTRRQQAAP